jgi:hypothetical protein
VAKTVTQFLVCNSVHAEAPPPPPGVERSHGICADCDTAISWIGAEKSGKSRMPHVCGRCALNHMRASAEEHCDSVSMVSETCHVSSDAGQRAVELVGQTAER